MKSKLIKIFVVAVGLALTIQILLIMKNSSPSEFKDPENAAFALIVDSKKFDEFGSGLEVKPVTGTDGLPISSSVAIAKFGDSGLKVKNYQSEGNASETLFSADSMTKMITAATILRISEEEKYQQFLPNGIETKLSDLLPLLKKHHPNSSYIQTELELQPDFEKITLQHLAQHISGLAHVQSDTFRNSDHKLLPDEMIDAAKKPKTGKFGERIGEYFYNDLGYELLGRVIIAVDSEQKGRASKFGDAVDELVINEVKEKIGEEEAANLRFFTSDQMEIIDGKTVALGHPELSVKFGKDYHEGHFREVPSHFYDMSCGGSYTNPESMSRIAFHVLHSSQEFSIFKKPETLKIFNSKQTAKYGLDGSPDSQGKTYGFGYESYSNPDFQRYRTHGGLGYGSNSNSFIDTKENKVAVAMVGFENLTLPIAYALTNKESPTESVRLDPKLYQKSSELSKNYSESQLVEMRQGLEKSYDDFRGKFDSIQKQKIDALDLSHPKKPSPNPEKDYAEKMSRVRGGEFNEI